MTRIIKQYQEFTIPRKPARILRKSCDFYEELLMNTTTTLKKAMLIATIDYQEQLGKAEAACSDATGISQFARRRTSATTAK